MRGIGGMSGLQIHFEIGKKEMSDFGLYSVVYVKEPFSNTAFLLKMKNKAKRS